MESVGSRPEHTEVGTF